MDLVGPGQLSTATFTSGAGQLTYSLSGGEVCAQPPGTTGACALQYYPTGENSNASYGPIIPNCGSGWWEYPSLQTQQITSIPPPVISSIDPSSGSTIGGTRVLIQGSNLDGATAVLFGGTPGTGVNTLAGDTIEAISPRVSAAGPVDIIVDANVQSTSPSPAAVFTYIYEPGVTGITVNPDILWTGQSATGTVTLNELAPPGGTTVELVVSGIEEASFVTAPATVPVPAGDNTSDTFTITTSATAWGEATITAGGPDGNALSTSVEISAAQIVIALPLPAGYLLIGQTATGTISVRTPAPPSGGHITLSTSNSAVASITPAVVPLSNGSTSATFTVTALSAGDFTISANYLGDSATTNPFAVRQEPPPVKPPLPPGPKPI